MNQKLKIVVSGILLYSLSCNSVMYGADESFVKRSANFIKNKFTTLTTTITQNKTTALAAGAAATVVTGAIITGAIIFKRSNTTKLENEEKDRKNKEAAAEKERQRIETERKNKEDKAKELEAEQKRIEAEKIKKEQELLDQEELDKQRKEDEQKNAENSEDDESNNAQSKSNEDNKENKGDKAEGDSSGAKTTDDSVKLPASGASSDTDKNQRDSNSLSGQLEELDKLGTTETRSSTEVQAANMEAQLAASLAATPPAPLHVRASLILPPPPDLSGDVFSSPTPPVSPTPENSDSEGSGEDASSEAGPSCEAVSSSLTSENLSNGPIVDLSNAASQPSQSDVIKKEVDAINAQSQAKTDALLARQEIAAATPSPSRGAKLVSGTLD